MHNSWCGERMFLYCKELEFARCKGSGSWVALLVPIEKVIGGCWFDISGDMEVNAKQEWEGVG